MRDFRLRRDDDEEGPLDAPEPIPFPSFDPPDASDAERSENKNADRAVRLARVIEDSLDEVQRRLDQVKNQLDDAFRLPGPDDWPPPAA